MTSTVSEHKRLLFALVSLSGVFLLFALDLARKSSPGPLSLTHARLEGLERASACAQCHGGIGESMAEACSECHEAIELQIDGDRGLHAGLEAELAEDCGQCHGEHHGIDLPLISRASFVLAGFDGREGFDHGPLGFALTGRHGELDCKECHEAADHDLLVEGTPRYLGLQADCVSCHEDPHEGRMQQACVQCHDPAFEFQQTRALEHEALALQDAHGALECTDCHEPESLHAIEAVASATPPPTRGCADCHESPHGLAFVTDAEAAGATCADCHPSIEHGFAFEAWGMDTELHAASGFNLVGAHAKAECEACHPTSLEGEQLAFAERFPGRERSACDLCHEDVHQGEFADGPFADRSCADCHDEHGFDSTRLTAEDHSLTGFLLEAAHAEPSCTDCHESDLEEGPLSFASASSDCESCHEDPHAEDFADGPFAQSSCAECHGTEAFKPADFGLAEHASLAFELDGAHAAVACVGCHGESLADAPPLFGDDPAECANCHEDAHAGAFDATLASLQIEPQDGCAHCHGTMRFDEIVDGRFDHDLWTSFALRGAHERVECEDCHPRSRQSDDFGRRFGRVDPTVAARAQACDGCHTDPHRGAFDDLAQHPDFARATRGRDGCARCHDESAWGAASGTFDHGAWTGFPLEGSHAVAGCVVCHTRGEEQEPQALRHVPLSQGTACADCHTDPHVGQFSLDGRTSCSRCHVDSRDWGARAFDHDRDSQFALDESHDSLECSACHRPWPLPGGGETVRYLPLGTTCVDCHGARETGGSR